MAGKIFVNYRRDDSQADAARVRDRLVAAFGVANVFMDVDNLLAGQRFDKELEKALAQCDVFVAVRNCSHRVLRGGSWAHVPKELRVADRNSLLQGDRSWGFGFRVARTLD